MTSMEITSGIGTRRGLAIPLDTRDGLPSINVSQAAPMQGTLIFGIKSATTSDPEPQRFTHYGQDDPYAQDTLPPQTVGNFTIVTAASNLALDAMVEGNSIVTINQDVWRAGNSNQRGNEPIMAAMFYRQALDTEPGSGTFGKLRQWNVRIYPAARISPATQSYDAGMTDKTYAGTPTPTGLTIWGQTYTESTWGNTRAEYTEGVTNYEPQPNWWLGNSTLTAFQLSHAPVTSTSLTVWVDGTLTTPASVNTSSTNPSFTLTSAAGTDQKKIFALIETLNPGNG